MRLCSIAPEAIRDLDQISTYFAGRNVESGDRLLGVFDEKCRKLMQFPMMGRSYGDFVSGDGGGIDYSAGCEWSAEFDEVVWRWLVGRSQGKCSGFPQNSKLQKMLPSI
jgi:plasmid stabilization system protein ParE